MNLLEPKMRHFLITHCNFRPFNCLYPKGRPTFNQKLLTVHFILKPIGSAGYKFFNVLKTFNTPDEIKYDINVFGTDIRLVRIIFHLSFLSTFAISEYFQEVKCLKLPF